MIREHTKEKMVRRVNKKKSKRTSKKQTLRSHRTGKAGR